MIYILLEVIILLLITKFGLQFDLDKRTSEYTLISKAIENTETDQEFNEFLKMVGSEGFYKDKEGNKVFMSLSMQRIATIFWNKLQSH